MKVLEWLKPTKTTKDHSSSDPLPVCAVVFPPKWCHFLEDDVINRSWLVKGILQDEMWYLELLIDWLSVKTMFPIKLVFK